MNRKEFLQASLTEDKNIESVIKITLSKDAKMINRAKRDLEDALEEAEEALKTRMMSQEPLDKATILVTYAKVKEFKDTIALYDEFKAEYFTEAK